MSRSLHNTTSLYKERRASEVVKKRVGENQEWYAAEYRRGRDPYRTPRLRAKQRDLDRRFEAGLQGIPLNEEVPVRGETLSGAPEPLQQRRVNGKPN